MAIFAEKLKSYIEKSGQTIYMVAQSSGVNTPKSTPDMNPVS